MSSGALLMPSSGSVPSTRIVRFRGPASAVLDRRLRIDLLFASLSFVFDPGLSTPLLAAPALAGVALAPAATAVYPEPRLGITN